MKKVIITLVLIVVAGIVLFMLLGRIFLPSVETTVAAFHEKFNSQDFAYIYNDMTSQEFKEALPFPPYDNFMKSMYSSLGPIQHSKRGLWGIFYKNVGLTINVEYNTIYEKGDVTEYFTFVRRGGVWQIVMYNPKTKKG